MLIPGIVWLGLIGSAAVYEWWASRPQSGRVTLSEWIWAIRKRRRWFGLMVGGLLIVLALHLLWPQPDPPPPPPAAPDVIVLDEE